jgi:hypothetical protein
LAFALLCVVAFFKATATTGDLSWPYDLDQFREIGMAQSVLDGRFGSDHVYGGETIWYNPLTSLVTAGVAHLSGAPISVVVTRAGPYLNLVAPISFYLLVLLLFGRATALAAGAAFLFGPTGNAPSWAAATYSPWLFSQNFAQSFFYLGLAAFIKAQRSTSLFRYCVCGVLLGFTFLAHTAPAVLLGTIVVVASIASWLRRETRDSRSLIQSKQAIGLCGMFAIAFAISIPFTRSILFHYHLRIQNPIPGNWVYAPLLKNNFAELALNYFSAFGLVALVGWIAAMKRPSQNGRRVLLLSWLAICLVFIAIGELQQFSDLHLLFVPPHHFLFYLQAVEDILFGVGLVWLVELVSHRLLPKILANRGVASISTERLVLALAVICFLAMEWPAYVRRFDFTTAREQAIGFEQRKEYLDAYRWILSNTKPTDIFLSLTGDLDLSIVGPADRKTLVTCQPEFSNPYVDWQSRSAIAAAIVDKLAHADHGAAAALSENHVAYIISWPLSALALEQLPFLSKPFTEGNIVIYKVTRD